jgi:hypothetical protein
MERTRMRIVEAALAAWCAFGLIGLVSACEKTVEPATGDRTRRVTVPLTPAHGERLDERWENCLQFRSVSACERRHPGARPLGGSAPAAPSASGAESREPAASEPAVSP